MVTFPCCWHTLWIKMTRPVNNKVSKSFRFFSGPTFKWINESFVSASPRFLLSLSLSLLFCSLPPSLYTHLSLSIVDCCRTGSVSDYFSADQRGSRPVRGNIVNVVDTVPSAYLQHVLNNRKPGEMSSPVITSGLFFLSSPYSILGVN